MTDYIIFDPIYKFFYMIAFVLMLELSILLFYLSKKRIEPSTKHFLLALAFNWMGSALTRLFYFISDYYIPGSYLGHIFYGDGSIPNEGQFFGTIAYQCTLIATCLSLFTLERYLIKTRYFFTSVNILGIILTFINRSFYMVFASIVSLFGLIMFFMIARWSKEEFKITIAFFISSFLLFILGSFLEGMQIKQLEVIPLWLSPVAMIISVCVCLIPLIKRSTFSKPRKYWYVLLFINILFFIVLIIFVFSFEIPIAYLMADVVLVILAIVQLIYVLKQIVRKEKTEHYKPKDTKAANIFEGIIKPQNFTEEEVSLYRDKAICLVCKGNVDGFSYICGNCKALYCKKCAEAISNLENTCWACNTIIDKSKPIKNKDDDVEEPKLEHHVKPIKKE